MNLIIRITLLFVFVSLGVFGIGGVISYRILLREVKTEQQRFLFERFRRVEGRIKRTMLKDTIRWNKMITYPIENYTQRSILFSDTLVMHSQLERLEPHLLLDAKFEVEGQGYRTILYDIIVEEDDIRDGVTKSLTTMYLILLIAVLIIGVAASYFILRPFNLTLAEIRKFSLRNPDQKMVFPKSNVSEFKRLNSFLTEMTEKVKSDYQSLKDFSENASHEFQTPIAIVQSKLEVLLDDDKLSQAQIEQLSSIQSAIRRLSNLSNSLALLTKIENNEFANIAQIDVSELLKNLIDEFKELLELKDLKLKQKIEIKTKLKADQVLIELLFTNLINNAIRHNWEGGSISIELTENYLEMTNTGPALTIEPEDLFRRFKKSNQSATSMGLGLAIVKKICDFYEYEVKYLTEAERHTIQIKFNPLAETS